MPDWFTVNYEISSYSAKDVDLYFFISSKIISHWQYVLGFLFFISIFKLFFFIQTFFLFCFLFFWNFNISYCYYFTNFLKWTSSSLLFLSLYFSQSVFSLHLVYMRVSWKVHRLTKILRPSRLGLQNTLTAPLQKGKTPSSECPRYDTKQSDGEVPVMLELWAMWRTPLLPLLPGTLWPGVVAPDSVLPMGQAVYLC